MACKRSGVRISLTPPGQKHNSNRSNRAVQQQSTATAAHWAAVRVFGSVSSAGADCWQGRGFQSPPWCLQACHLGKFLCFGCIDTCHLGRHPARGSGQPGCDRCRICRWSRDASSGIPDPLPEPAPVIRGVGARIAPVGAGRRAGWRRRACALRRLGAGPRRGAASVQSPGTRCAGHRRSV